GANGVASASFGSQNSYPRGIALQPDGKIVVVGQNPNSGMGDFGVVRFTTAGQPDATFCHGGEIDIAFFCAVHRAQAGAIPPGGGIIVGGSARNGSVGDVGLVRILP